jgi:crossover junction endodeoxyribonuclease RusA
MLSFVVPGQPIAKGRPRFVGGHAITPARTKEYEQRVAVYAANAMAHAGQDLLTGDLAIAVRFYLPSRRSEPDLDNLIKAALDGCNGTLYADDRQVAHLVGWKGYDAADPRTEIEAGPVEQRQEGADAPAHL